MCGQYHACSGVCDCSKAWYWLHPFCRHGPMRAAGVFPGPDAGPTCNPYCIILSC